MLSLSADDEDDDDLDDDDQPLPEESSYEVNITEEHLGEEGDHAGDDHRDHHQPHIAVADMGQFVAEHRFHLVVVQRVQKPAVTVMEYCLR